MRPSAKEYDFNFFQALELQGSAVQGMPTSEISPVLVMVTPFPEQSRNRY